MSHMDTRWTWGTVWTSVPPAARGAAKSSSKAVSWTGSYYTWGLEDDFQEKHLAISRPAAI